MSNIDNAIYFKDELTIEDQLVRRYYSNGVGVPKGTDGIIPSNEAFYIKANDFNPVFVFEESNKTMEMSVPNTTKNITWNLFAEMLPRGRPNQR